MGVVIQALDAALKQLKGGLPNTAAMLLSVDQENGKLTCLCQVPSVSEADPQPLSLTA